MEEQKRPGVGLSLILINSARKEILLLKRKNSHGHGTWSFPGGHIEKFESFYDALEREMKEETGLHLGINYMLIDKRPSAITNDLFMQENKHYITLFFRALYKQGQQVNTEPEKCEELAWYEWGKFPDNLFLPVKNLLSQDYSPFK